MSTVHETTFRRPTPEDHPAVLAVLGQWWGDTSAEAVRQRALLLPRLFFQHFTDTSCIVERQGELSAFLIGFLSQSRPDESYVHFVGVCPQARGRGLGRQLYERFFALSREHGRSRVRAITSDVNAGSHGFHTRMGFIAEPGPATFEGRPVQPDYDGPGLDRVTFVRTL